MKKKFPIIAGGLLVALIVIGAIGASIVYAQQGTPSVPFNLPGDGRGPHDGRGLGDAELQAAATALNMTTDEVKSALQSGKTLEQIATDAGVDVQKVKDAISAAHREEMRTRIQQGVADGTISQDKAKWLLEGLDKGFLDGPGFGFGFGGPRGDRNGQPPAQSTPGSGQ